MPPALSTDTRAAADSDSGRWSFQQQPPRHWYARPCGHVTGDQSLVLEPCPYCETNADGEKQEQLLMVEEEGVDYALRVARARRDARLARPPIVA